MAEFAPYRLPYRRDDHYITLTERIDRPEAVLVIVGRIFRYNVRFDRMHGKGIARARASGNNGRMSGLITL